MISTKPKQAIIKKFVAPILLLYLDWGSTLLTWKTFGTGMFLPEYVSVKLLHYYISRLLIFHSRFFIFVLQAFWIVAFLKNFLMTSWLRQFDVCLIQSYWKSKIFNTTKILQYLRLIQGGFLLENSWIERNFTFFFLFHVEPNLLWLDGQIG